VNILIIKNNKMIFIKNYISIFLGLYVIYTWNILYNEFILNKTIEIWILWAFQFYWLITIIEAVILLLLIYIFFNSIYKIELKNIQLYFLILFTTLFYIVFLHIFDNENPLFLILFYIIWFWWYLYYLKYIKKNNL